MLCKKRWSDGLNQDFDHLNEFEAKFYCFGGDGGGGGGASSEPEGTKFRGGKISDETKVNIPDAPPSRPPSNVIEQMNRQRTLDMVNRAAQDSLRSRQNIAPRDLPTMPDPTTFQPGLGIGEPTMPTDFQSGRGIGEPATPTTFNPASFTTETPGLPSLPSIADMIDMAPAANVNTYSPPTQQNVNPLSVDFGPGTLTPTFDPANQGVDLNFSIPFNTSSVSQQGIGSLDQNRVMDALTSGVNNPQATTAPTTDVAFMDTVQNVFGTLPGQTKYSGNLARRGNTYTSASTGGRSSTQKQKNFLDQIAGTGKTMASQVGLGSLFN